MRKRSGSTPGPFGFFAAVVLLIQAASVAGLIWLAMVVAQYIGQVLVLNGVKLP